MADSKISALGDGASLKASDNLVIARSGQNYKILGSVVATKLYDYTVTGSDKTTIDTQVDDGGNGAAALPTDFAILEILIYVRTDEAVTLSDLAITLNNDTGSNYDRYDQDAAGTTAAAVGFQGATTAWHVFPPGASGAANYFGVIEIVIPNYGGTVGYKNAIAQSNCPDSTQANNRIDFDSLTYKSTSAISRLAITPATSGKKLKVGTRLLIYAR